MRNTFFDVDQDSTIVSMLTVRDMRDAAQPSKSPLSYKVLAGCAAIVLLILYLGGGTAWQ